MLLPPGAVSLDDDGGRRMITQLVFLPDGKRVAAIFAYAASRFYRARVYDANTGALQLTLSSPEESNEVEHTCIAVLGGELGVTGSVIQETCRHSTPGELSFAFSVWHATTGRRLHQSILASPVCVIVAIDSSRFVTAARDGTLAFYRHRGGEDVAVYQCFPNVFDSKLIYEGVRAGNRIATHGGKMVCVSGDKTVQVWDVDAMAVRGTLDGHAKNVTGVALGTVHIVTTTVDSSGPNMYIWDAVNYYSLHRLHFQSRSLPLFPVIFADSLVLTTSISGQQVLTELATGVSVYRVKMEIGVSGVAIAPDGRIAIGYCEGGDSRAGAILKALAPVAQIVRARAASAGAVAGQSKPIKEMFAKLCAGDIGSDEAVAKVINPDACAASLSEFLHAHHLALVAVKCGGVPGTTSFSFTEGSIEMVGGTTVTTRIFGGPNWWFLNLYCSARKLQLSKISLRMVQSCLAEAADAGLIEGTEGALSTIVSRDDLRQGMEVMQSGAIRICRMLADLQDEISILQSGQSELVDNFSTLLSGQAAIERELVVKEKQLEAIAVAFRRFQKRQAVAHLVGFGLQLIPFAGGALAEAVSGAAAVGELAKDLLGAGVGMIGESQTLIADRIFVKAGKSVESLGNAEAELVAKLGIRDVSELRQMFVQGRANICDLSEADMAVEFELIVQQFSGILAVAKEHEGDLEGPLPEDAYYSDCRRADDGLTDADSSLVERLSDNDSGEGSTSVVEMPDFESNFAALKLARREIKVDALEEMLLSDLVRLIAADLVSFNSQYADRFKLLCASLTTALEILEVFTGDDLVGEDPCVGSETFSRGVIEQLERDDLVGPTTRKRLDRFMAKVSGE